MEAIDIRELGWRIWRGSTTYRVIAVWLRLAAGARNFCMDWGLKRWQPYLESLLIILVVLMPVLKSWELTMPLLLLLWMGSDGTVNLLTGELFGLWAVWILSAALSGSFKAGLPSLISFSGWLGIAYW
ncbi:MAG TPA: hypothetical protein DDW50_09965, partial [Firmicutes bacterium]|nr:hypothetical protein [Bacillota bacterium]